MTGPYPEPATALTAANSGRAVIAVRARIRMGADGNRPQACREQVLGRKQPEPTIPSAPAMVAAAGRTPDTQRYAAAPA